MRMNDDVETHFTVRAGAMQPHPDRECIRVHFENIVRAETKAERVRLGDEIKTVEDGLAPGADRITRLRDEIAKTDLFSRRVTPGERPWTLVELAKVGLLGLISGAMILVCWSTLTTILLNSGLVQARWEAGTFSILPLALPLVLKTLGTSRATDAAGRQYGGVLAIVAVIGGVVWSVLFAVKFGSSLSSLSQSGGDFMATIASAPTGPSSADSLLTIAFLVAGLLTEGPIAALAWVEIERAVEAHAKVEIIANPARVARDGELSALIQQQVEPRASLHRLQARERELAAAEAAFVSEALAKFDLACLDWTNRHSQFFSTSLGREGVLVNPVVRQPVMARVHEHDATHLNGIGARL
jgi:hypothetical protein